MQRLPCTAARAAVSCSPAPLSPAPRRAPGAPAPTAPPRRRVWPADRCRRRGLPGAPPGLPCSPTCRGPSPPGAGLHALAQLAAVHQRHHHVGEQELRRESSLDGGERLRSIACLLHPVAGVSQRRGDEGPDGLLVFHQEDGLGAPRG